MKKIIASVLSMLIVCSAFILPTSAYDDGENRNVYETEPGKSFYYVMSQSFNHALESQHNIAEQDETETLTIYNFSKDFGGYFWVPDEIGGVKYENVVLKDYTRFEILVLSDGIKKFACHSDSYDDCYDYIDREANNVSKIHLGREFTPEGLDELKSVRGRFENLETVTIAPDNPYFAMYNGSVYSKDFTKLLLVPAKNPHKNRAVLHKKTKEITDRAYLYNSNIEEIKNLKQIEKIGEGAFYGASSIKEIHLGDKVTKLPYELFEKCSLRKVTLGPNITKVDGKVFYKTKNLKTVVLGDKVKEIGASAFEKSNVQNVILGKKVKKIGHSCFDRSKLKNLTIKRKLKADYINDFYRVKNLNIYAKNKKIADSVKKACSNILYKSVMRKVNIYIGKTLYCKIDNRVDKLVINNKTKIESEEYQACDIKEVIVGDKVNTIEEYAFEHSSVKKATIGKVDEIKQYAFYDSKLEEITFNGKTKLNYGIFMDTPLKKVVVNDKITFKRSTEPFKWINNITFYAKNKSIAKHIYNLIKTKERKTKSGYIKKTYYINGFKIYVGNALMYEEKFELFVS